MGKRVRAMPKGEGDATHDSGNWKFQRSSKTIPTRPYRHCDTPRLKRLPALTIADRFSRWPMAIPIRETTTQAVMDAFAHNWISAFGVPESVTSDRGPQFTSALWQQLLDTWGIRSHLTTPYHPESNGLVERLHRRLKEALIALGNDEPHEWFWRLPMVMLAVRTTLKPDIGSSPADLVYGEGLTVPGELLGGVAPNDDQLAQLQRGALQELRMEVARLQPKAASAHRTPRVHVPDALETATHVFVRRGGVQATLTTPYSGPYRVVSRQENAFRIAIPGVGNEPISVARLKPAFLPVDDDGLPATPPDPPSPPPQGRRPGIRTRMPEPTTRVTRQGSAPQPESAQAQTPPQAAEQEQGTNVKIEVDEAQEEQPPQPVPGPSNQEAPSAPIRRPRYFSNPGPSNFSYRGTRPKPNTSLISSMITEHLNS